MIVFPNAKINLGLNIIEKRSDGFHNIETVFLPINICDVLEIITNNNATKEIEFTNSGLEVDGNSENNLCVQAYKLLKQNFNLPPVKIHLHKVIPMGAGLGGGSSNAAFTLKLLNNKFSLNLSTHQLINFALQLGSDCPFFIINKPCFAQLRGEKLQSIHLNLANYKIVIINPNIHISTAQAFANIIPTKPIQSIQNIVEQPIEKWKNMLVNDFENAAFENHLAIKNIKEILYKNNAIYTAMSGTGSTMYGIFDAAFIETNFGFTENYFIKWIDIKQ